MRGWWWIGVLSGSVYKARLGVCLNYTFRTLGGSGLFPYDYGVLRIVGLYYGDIRLGSGQSPVGWPRRLICASTRDCCSSAVASYRNASVIEPYDPR